MKIKGFDKDLKCRGMQFEIGKIYDTGAKEDEIKLCTDTVFHYCDSLIKVHEYYSCMEDNRFCEVEVLGKEVTDGQKYGSNRIKIVREIIGEELKLLKGLINGNSGLFNSGDCNSGDCNSGNCNSGNYNSGYYNSGNCNSGYYNSGNYNSGNCNSGYYNSGNYNKCDYSSGFFCTIEPKARIFNIETDMTVSEFKRSKYCQAINSSCFFLTKWVDFSEEEMKNDEEKRKIGGYLKKYSYEEACANWWDEMSDKDKKIIMSIPNFDKEIFKEITGIEV